MLRPWSAAGSTERFSELAIVQGVAHDHCLLDASRSPKRHCDIVGAHLNFSTVKLPKVI